MSKSVYWIKWIILGFSYMGASLATLGMGFIYIVVVMIMANSAVAKDKLRSKNPEDEFYGEDFPLHYGIEESNNTLMIPTKPDWDNFQTNDFVNEFEKKILAKIKKEFPTSNVESFIVNVADSITNQSRKFVKVVFQSPAGSEVTHFLHYDQLETSIVAHYFTYAKGHEDGYKKFDFVYSSPLSILSWGIPWLEKKFSISSQICGGIDRPYDLIAARTFFAASYNIIYSETQSILEEEGLLTDELNQIIVNNITNAPEINVNNSSGVSFGGTIGVLFGQNKKQR